MTTTGSKEEDSAEKYYKTQNIFFKPLVTKVAGATVKLGENNVFHPMVYIYSEGGEVVIGSFNVFEEKVFVYNRSKTQPLIIGDANVFRVGARVQSSVVGSLNELGANSFVDGCVLGKCNILAADARLKPSAQPLEHKTVSQAGVVADNLLYDETRRKKIVSMMVKKTYELYKRLVSMKMERSSVQQQQPAPKKA